MTSPSVSVLLPVWNAEPFLQEALDSLAGQTLEDHEVIAVDDGSDDRTPRILRDRAECDPRLRVVTTRHAGIVGALERARAEARGRYLARMDADDRAHPRRLARQLQAMEDHGDWVGCGCHTRYFPRGGLTGGARRYEKWLHSIRTPEALNRDRFVECPLAHPTFFLRADMVERVGGYRDPGWPEDYDLLLRLHAEGPLGVVPEVLLDWRDRPDRLSRTHDRYAEDAFRRCKLRYLLPEVGERPLVIWGAGPVGKGFARLLLEGGRSPRAFVDLDPRKIGQEIHGATVVHPGDISELEGAFCLAAVAQKGAREEIRQALSRAGWRELEDYVAVA